MKKARNIVLALLCALLLIVGSVAGTLAYLTDTKTVTNTFTVGNVRITLDEAPINKETGKAVTGDRVTTGYTDVLLVPGREIEKDPTVHVLENSEACWLFVKVTNNLTDIEADAADDDTIGEQILANGWTALDGQSGVYYKQVNKNDTVQDFVVFKTFTVDADVINTILAAYEDKTIEVVAYAIQSEGVATAAAAWTLLNP